jgi:hypothetical protein
MHKFFWLVAAVAIWSMNSFAADPTLTGKLNFYTNYRYDKNAKKAVYDLKETFSLPASEKDPVLTADYFFAGKAACYVDSAQAAETLIANAFTSANPTGYVLQNLEVKSVPCGTGVEDVVSFTATNPQGQTLRWGKLGACTRRCFTPRH